MGNLTEEDYKKIRQRVEERFEKRSEWVSHLTAYVFVNLGLHYFFGWGSVPAMMVTIFWGMGLAIHTAQVLFETSTDRAKERAIQREIELELYHKEGRVPSFAKKRKNEERFGHLRIGYDGELVAVDDETSVSNNDYQNDERN